MMVIVLIINKQKLRAAEDHIQALTLELSVANSTLRDHTSMHSSALRQFDDLLSEYRLRSDSADSDISTLRKRLSSLELELSRKDEVASVASAQRELAHAKILRERELDAAQREIAHTKILRERELDSAELVRLREELRASKALIAQYEVDVKQVTGDAMRVVVENERLARAVQAQEPSLAMFNEMKEKAAQKEAEVLKLQVCYFIGIVWCFRHS